VATYVLTYVAGVLAITAVAAFVLYRRIEKNIVQPIEELNAASKRMVDSLETGEDVSLDIHTGDELEELSDSFVAMYGEIGAYVRENARITAERERIGTELSLASKIQADMLPSAFPAFSERKEFTVYASMTPAKEVGGDFYDFFLVDHDHLGVVIADVSGKGVPAALFMMMAKIMIEGNASMGVGPGEALQMVNNKICENNREDMFVTVWLGILELSTGRLVAANAGHDKPVLMRPGGDFEVYADRHGFVLGGMEGMVYREYELTLEPGCKLFLYTDGVPEANDADENLFGMERTLEALNKAKDGTAYDEIQSVQDAVGRFVGDAPQFDDLTMLCLQYNGVDEEANAKGGLAC
jgi:sigma-B regulation protein RsbU (phosphoserine phosphatase)